MGDISIDSNTRIATVRAQVAGPPPREAVGSAQNLLNMLAGNARYPVTGELDARTREGLESFQASAGLPATGLPDGATMTALERESTRVLAAREASSDAIGSDAVDDAVASFDEARGWSTPGIASPSSVPTERSALRSLAGRALGEGQTQHIAHELRERYDLPHERTRVSGRGGEVDGWSADNRRIGLDIVTGQGDDSEGRLLIDVALEGLANRGAGLRGLDAADERYGRCDRALVLMVAARETRGGAMTRAHGELNTYFEGGMDFLGALRDTNLFSAAERKQITALPGSTNEHQKKINPAFLPAHLQIRAYAACVEHATRRVETELAERGVELSDLSVDVQRFLVQTAFGAPYGAQYRGQDATYGNHFGLNTVLGRMEATGQLPVGADAVLQDPWLREFDVVRRSVVTSVETRGLEEALDHAARSQAVEPSAPTPVSAGPSADSALGAARSTSWLRG